MDKTCYLVYSLGNFEINENLKLFNQENDCIFLGHVSNFEDLYVKFPKLKIDVLFLIINEDIDVNALESSIVSFKNIKPQMCICLFIDIDHKFDCADYQFSTKSYNLQIYNVILKYKKQTRELGNGFYVSTNKITELFDILEIRKKYKGYEYLKEAVELMCRKSKMYYGHMTNLYKDISEKYGVKVSAIERCIRLVINESSLELNSKKLLDTKYEPLVATMIRAGNSEFIKSVVTFLEESLA